MKKITEQISLRPVVDGDDAFLEELYFTTRDDLAEVFPDAEQLRTLLRMQYRAQVIGYAQQFPNASHDIVLHDGEPTGRTLIERRPGVTNFIDMSFLPQFRGRGIGSSIFEWLLSECSRNHVACELSVLKTNPAKRLYDRIGFVVVADDGLRFTMRWTDESKSGNR